MIKVKNDRLLRALARQKVDKTPVWIMRQAGRYLPEYRNIRNKLSDFMQLCKNSELATEVALQPIRRYPLDAAILFSDILTIPDAMGLGVYFETGEGPKLRKPLVDAKSIDQLQLPNCAGELSYVFDTIKKINKELNNSIPLLGFAGSPWTLACYMIEGGSSENFKKIKAKMYDEPESLHQLLSILAVVLSDYLQLQIESGVHAIQIFDTWGGILNDYNYNIFSLNYIKKIINNLRMTNPSIPIILFTKQGGQLLKHILTADIDAVSLDWTCNLQDARNLVANRVALQGNLDPCILYASESSIFKETSKILQIFGSDTGHIFNLGHGINPDTDPEKVKFLINAVHNISEKYHDAITQC